MPLNTALTPVLAWRHGPARLDGDRVVMTVDHAAADLTLSISDDVDVELARITSAEQALGFVQRFGLLRIAYWSDLHYEGTHTTPHRAIPAEASEPVTEFLTASGELRLVLGLMRDVRNAEGGDHAAVDRLREWARHRWRAADGRHLSPAQQRRILSQNLNDPHFLKHLTAELAEILNTGIHADGAPVLQLTGPYYPVTAIDLRESADRLKFRIKLATLRALAFWTLAHKLMTRAPIVACPECGLAFVAGHGAQAFCSRNCARRARYRVSRRSTRQ